MIFGIFLDDFSVRKTGCYDMFLLLHFFSIFVRISYFHGHLWLTYGWLWSISCTFCRCGSLVLAMGTTRYGSTMSARSFTTSDSAYSLFGCLAAIFMGV